MKIEDQEFTFGKLLKWGLLGVVGVGIIGVAASYMHTTASIATAPARVVSRTLETDNIINNYEWFHDANAQYRSRLAQTAEHKTMVAEASDTSERSRLAIELSAVRQSCRDLATRYNANATKSNRSIFMGKEAPDNLSLEACDR